MCLYPRLMYNPKYKANKKNRGEIPPIKDQRTVYVPVGCGVCIECKKQNARNWQLRLLEDIKQHTNGKFITLTFSDEGIKKIGVDIKTGKLNNRLSELEKEMQTELGIDKNSAVSIVTGKQIGRAHV